MKLHLPKLLLTAVMAACVAPAFADYVIDTNVSVSAEALFEDRYGKDENEFGIKMRYFF